MLEIGIKQNATIVVLKKDYANVVMEDDRDRWNRVANMRSLKSFAGEPLERLFFSNFFSSFPEQKLESNENLLEIEKKNIIFNFKKITAF